MLLLSAAGPRGVSPFGRNAGAVLLDSHQSLHVVTPALVRIQWSFHRCAEWLLPSSIGRSSRMYFSEPALVLLHAVAVRVWFLQLRFLMFGFALGKSAMSSLRHL